MENRKSKIRSENGAVLGRGSMDKSFLTVVFCILTMACLLLPGCRHPDYTVDLPNGYSLVRANPHDISICGSFFQAIPPRIALIGVRGDLVFGLVEDSGDKRLDASVNDMYGKTRGYFLLNTITHKVQLGLKKEAWIRTLKDNGIDGEPRMGKPSRWLRGI